MDVKKPQLSGMGQAAVAGVFSTSLEDRPFPAAMSRNYFRQGVGGSFPSINSNHPQQQPPPSSSIQQSGVKNGGASARR